MPGEPCSPHVLGVWKQFLSLWNCEFRWKRHIAGVFPVFPRQDLALRKASQEGETGFLLTSFCLDFHLLFWEDCCVLADTGLDIKDVVMMKTGRIPAKSHEGLWSHMGHASEPGPVASPCNRSSPACSSPEPLVMPEEALLGAGFFLLFI